MDLKSLSLPERFAAGAGCVLVLATLFAGALYGFFEIRAAARMDAELDGAPAGWAAAVRNQARTPDLAGLVSARTEPGDGAAEAHDSSRAWRLPGFETSYRALVGGPQAASAFDSSVWLRVGADTSLDRFVRLARRREWRALDAVLKGDTGLARRNVLAIPVPRYGDLRNACRALVMRAIMRLDRGDRDGARADLGAAMAIGEQVFRREPFLVGTIVGRTIMASAANGWTRLASHADDSALALRARSVRDWAAPPPSTIAEYLMASPDTALAMARDTSLALGLRSEGLTDILLGYMVRPRGSLFGVPAEYRAAMRSLAADPDSDLARIAAMTAATAQRVHFRGLDALIRETQPRNPE